MDKSQQAYSKWYRENCGQPHDLRVIWDAAWQASRKQALEEALAACKGRTIEATEPFSARYLYQLAVADCAHAIRSLEGNAKEKKCSSR